MVLGSQPLRSEACSRLGRLKVRTRCHGTMQVITLAGDLDLATVADFERALGRLERITRVVAIDLRELMFIGSAGIAAIIQANETASERGYRLLVVGGNPAVQRVVRICGLADSLPFVAALPSDAAAPATAAATVGRRSPRLPARQPVRATTRRRGEEAALAAAVRDLRTHRRARATR